MLSIETLLEELEAAIYTYNDIGDGEYGFKLDKDSGVITLEEYGDYNEETNSVEIVNTKQVKVVEI